MHPAHDDTRIGQLRPLLPPAILIEEIPLTPAALDTVIRGRREAEAILSGGDDRLLVVCGPCSIHDPGAAVDYATELKRLADLHRDRLCVFMRTYFEKPRTVVGWKGLINDPEIDGSFEINRGLRIARRLLVDIGELGLPTGAEFLDTILPQFIADAIAWAAIGARTTESQVHRELASGLSMPVGFKNGTSGNTQIALDAVRSARVPHWFPSVTKQGVTAIFETRGNPYGHVILRGGSRTGPNYSSESIAAVAHQLESFNLPPYLIVDCSHANSDKDFRKQGAVALDLTQQIRDGNRNIVGVMLESNLVEGRQDFRHGRANTRGQSITDACIGIEETASLLEQLGAAVEARARRSATT